TDFRAARAGDLRYYFTGRWVDNVHGAAIIGSRPFVIDEVHVACHSYSFGIGPPTGGRMHSCLGGDYCFALSSSTATAGSFLPSTYSRKAPPPDEEEPISRAMPYLPMAASASPPPAMENAGERAMARETTSAPLAK